MPLSPYAVGSLAKFKARAQVKQSSTELDNEMNDVLSAASLVAEDVIVNEFITRGSQVEYHNIREPRVHIWTRVFPIISIASLFEDPGRSYTGSGLTNDQDFLASKARGRITRVSGSVPLEWLRGERVLKLTYSAGYADASAIPLPLEHFVLNFATMIWREITLKTINVTTWSDDLGNVTRYAQAMITPQMLAPVKRYGRSFAGTPTVDRG